MSDRPRAELPEHVAENRRFWDAMADDWVAAGERSWAAPEPYWGAWQLPEADLGLLPDDLTGRRAIELGCGTGYVSGWLARRGAAVVGIDNSARQLETASRLAAAHGVDLTLHHGNAEEVPEPDGSFDLAISEYGAAIWCDPDRWIPEAHRLLRPGGQLVFLGNHPLAMICWAPDGSVVTDTLHAAYFDIGRFDWTEAEVDPGGIEFNRPISAWLRLFREVGFDVDDHLELRVPLGDGDDPEENRFGVTRRWAHDHPCEQVWKLTKR